MTLYTTLTQPDEATPAACFLAFLRQLLPHNMPQPKSQISRRATALQSSEKLLTNIISMQNTSLTEKHKFMFAPIAH